MERLDRLERVLGSAIRLADKRMDRIEQKLENLVDAHTNLVNAIAKTDQGLDKLHEEVRNLIAVAHAYFERQDGRP